jgi:hypothetical protein
MKNITSLYPKIGKELLDKKDALFSIKTIILSLK